MTAVTCTESQPIDRVGTRAAKSKKLLSFFSMSHPKQRPKGPSTEREWKERPDTQRRVVSAGGEFTQSRNVGSSMFFDREEDAEFLFGRLKVCLGRQI